MEGQTGHCLRHAQQSVGCVLLGRGAVNNTDGQDEAVCVCGGVNLVLSDRIGFFLVLFFSPIEVLMPLPLK